MTDLFGQVAVTWGDVDAWLVAVAQVDPDSPRAAYYARCWDVAGKVARAKAAGTFEAATQIKTPGRQAREESH
jgi:hypothetical protein